jgi:branched-chain amino acid transport system substrate-binding protein
MHKIFKSAMSLLCAAAAILVGGHAFAQSVIKVGIIGDFTGPFATVGESYRQGIQAYLAKNGDTVGGQKLELIYRDAAGKPGDAARLAQELVVKDGVKIIGGLTLSSAVAAVAPIMTDAKTPFTSFSAAAPGLAKQSPYFVRSGQDVRASGRTAAQSALKNGKKRAYTSVADYVAGQQAEEAFAIEFKAGGGEIVGQDRIPLSTVDYTPYAERVANANPDALQIFVPTGAPAVSFLQALGSRGMMKKIMVIGTGAEAEDNDLRLFNDTVEGYYSVMYMTAQLDTPLNKWFKDYLVKTFGADAQPNPHSVGAYDGMRVIAKMIEGQSGKEFSSDAAIKSVIGYSFEGLRGPMKINEDRELTQNYYLRQVKKVDGKLQNVLLDTLANIKP